ARRRSWSARRRRRSCSSPWRRLRTERWVRRSGWAPAAGVPAQSVGSVSQLGQPAWSSRLGQSAQPASSAGQELRRAVDCDVAAAADHAAPRAAHVGLAAQGRGRAQRAGGLDH
ncbi:MAG: hypothetical protein ACK559_05950, partial [bacterium]